MFSYDTCVTRVRARALRRRLHDGIHYYDTASVLLRRSSVTVVRVCVRVAAATLDHRFVVVVAVFCAFGFDIILLFIFFFRSVRRALSSLNIFTGRVSDHGSVFRSIYTHPFSPFYRRLVGRSAAGTKQCARIANAENGRRYCSCKHGRPKIALLPVVYAVAVAAFRWKSPKLFSKVPTQLFFFTSMFYHFPRDQLFFLSFFTHITRRRVARERARESK